MSLDGSLFPDLILVITVAAFAGIVVVWPRLSERRPAVIAARAGSLAVVNLLVLLAFATQLNSRYLFFASWSDLLGSASGPHTASMSRGAQAAKAVDQPVTGTAAHPGPTVPPLPPGGQVRSYIVKGALSGITGQIMVELPPGYTTPADAAVRYPVLETFGGYPGSTGQWIQSMKVGDVLNSGVADGRIRPALVVSPQVEVPSGNDTECVNGGSGRPAVETWIADDVPNWVARTFRVSAARSSWATIGFSAGGWCAAMTTMLHPAQYAAAVVMGGYFRPDFGPLYEPFRPSSAAGRRYDLVGLAEQHPPPVAIWLETSHADPLSYSSSAAMLRAVRAPMAVQATVLKDAGHRMSIWQAELPQVVLWLGADVPGFAPVSALSKQA